MGQPGRTQSLPPESHTVGWICALPCELTAAVAMLDHRYTWPQNQFRPDENNYTLGSIAGHHVAIVCLPEYGTNKAAIAAKSMQATFPNIRFGLLVGVRGGVPGHITDTVGTNAIRLGDAVVSLPAEQGGEIDGFRRVGALNNKQAANSFKECSCELEAELWLGRHLAGSIHGSNNDDEEEGAELWTYPGIDMDVLFAPGFKHHPPGAQNYNKCIEIGSPAYTATRAVRRTTYPMVHYDNIGSNDSLVKDGLERDELVQRDSVISFEMEAAGLMDDFPCVVIRGISDYADLH
ncbi:nucleoside phosphorylase domain-containing protein [Aspergillus varians]